MREDFRLDTSLEDRIKKIQLLGMDVDGILTDGGIFITRDGQDYKRFHARDGQGIKLAHKCGLITGIISARTSVAVTIRAEELGIKYVYQGINDKLEAFYSILNNINLTPAEGAYMGDDILDMPIMKIAGLSITVSDAPPYIQKISHITTVKSGGNGAVREAIELILKVQGKLDTILSEYG